MPGRHYSSANYRYGFNGKENDNDVKGVEGSQQDYGMRIYDARIGRFLSVDPLMKGYPMLTPYQYASNTPIAAVDKDGEEAEVVVDKAKKEMHINLKIKYTDVEENLLKGQKIALEKLVECFDHYWKPNKDGLPEALVDIQNQTGVTPKQLDDAQKGGAARGGDGYFNVDFGNGNSYKVFFNLTLSKEFNDKDPTVKNLNVDPTTSASELSGKVFNLGTKLGVIMQHMGHEPGHQLGLVDYYEGAFCEKGYCTLNPRMLSVKKGSHEFHIGEVMDGSLHFFYVSTQSIVNALKPALDKASEVPENKVTVCTGEVNYSFGYQSTGEAHRDPTIITKKE